jgi:hypothetical protein
MMLPVFAPHGVPNPEDLIKLYAEIAPMTYCMVQNAIVVNIIDWDGVTPYTPPEGCDLYPWDGPVSIGWDWVDGAPVDPNPPPPPPPPVDPAVPSEGPMVL